MVWFNVVIYKLCSFLIVYKVNVVSTWIWNMNMIIIGLLQINGWFDTNYVWGTHSQEIKNFWLCLWIGSCNWVCKPLNVIQSLESYKVCW
jgi:hypothetical protein